MPIDLSKYPNNWKAIAHSVKEDANWICQHCRRPCRQPNQTWESFQEQLSALVDNQLAKECQEKPRRFVLTVAHYPDPDPHNVSRVNLTALCSVCHLKLDAKLHAKNAAVTRARKQIAKTKVRKRLGK